MSLKFFALLNIVSNQIYSSSKGLELIAYLQIIFRILKKLIYI